MEEGVLGVSLTSVGTSGIFPAVGLKFGAEVIGLNVKRAPSHNDHGSFFTPLPIGKAFRHLPANS